MFNGGRQVEVNIGEQGIMGITYLSTRRPVDLSTRVDRSRGKYRSASDYGYSILLPGSTGPEVNIGEHSIFRTCPPVDLLTCQLVYQD